MGRQEEAVFLGQDFRMGGGSSTLAVCDAGGGAWLLTGASGPRRLTEKEFDPLLNRIVEVLATRREMRAPKLDADDRIAFLQAAGCLCTRGSDLFAGVVCPHHKEATTFASLGISLEGR